ncbi:MAG: PD-(D/E)XK nuclease family protein, partial [Dehalococcoidia bacterium]
MTLALNPISFTASEVTTFEDCQSRFYHQHQRHTTALVTTDNTAADVSSAAHKALMEAHRQVERDYERSVLQAPEVYQRSIAFRLNENLRRMHVTQSDPDVAARLAKAASGIRKTVLLLLSDMPNWIRDPRHDR